jgi:hypothetical protein
MFGSFVVVKVFGSFVVAGGVFIVSFSLFDKINLVH